MTIVVPVAFWVGLMLWVLLGAVFLLGWSSAVFVLRVRGRLRD